MKPRVSSEFCELVHRIMRVNGSGEPVHDRLMVRVAGVMEEQPKKGKPAPSWYVAASDKLAPLIQHQKCCEFSMHTQPQAAS